MNPAERIVEKFGGTRPMARITGRPPSTIQSWKDAGFIPARHQPDVLMLGRTAGIDIGPGDFFDLPDAPPQPKPKGAAA